MRDLLERWQAVHDTVLGVNPFGSERRYARLSRAPDVAEGYWRVIHSGYIEGWKAHPDKAHGQWDVLAATVEAIEARGLHWSLSRVTFTTPPIGEGYKAFVTGGKSAMNHDHYDTPAAALLSAYLNAIEAT